MESCSSSKKSIFNFFQKNKRKENQVTKEADLKSQKMVKKLSIFGNVRETLNKITKKISPPDIGEEKSIDLPDEVLLYIFHFFVKLPNFKIDDLVNLRLVSRQYKLVSQDNSLWELFLHQKVQDRFSEKMSSEIFIDNFKRAIFDAKNDPESCFNKLTFFSEDNDLYGILEPNTLTKIILLLVKNKPFEVAKKMDEFAVSSERCRFRIFQRIFNSCCRVDDFNGLMIYLKKFNLSRTHEQTMVRSINIKRERCNYFAEKIKVMNEVIDYEKTYRDEVEKGISSEGAHNRRLYRHYQMCEKRGYDPTDTMPLFY